MLTGILVLAFLVGGPLVLVYCSEYAGQKWNELQSRRWERKLLQTTLEIDEEMKRPSEREILEAERELALEMEEW